ncbi:MAG: zinc-dependent metalloprotease [Motilibacteraceae bacterium]
MSDLPFGFRPPSDGGDDENNGGSGGSGGSGGGGQVPFGFGGSDPFSALFGNLGAAGLGGPGGPDLGAAFAQLGKVMSWQGGAVNWDVARDVARQGAAASNDRYVGQAEKDAVVEAARLAEHWLDEVTTLPAGTAGAVAWSRAEWVEGTLPGWRALVDPIAGKVVEAMSSALGNQALGANLPEEMKAQMAALTGPLEQMMRAVGGAVFGTQFGTALGELAGEVVGSTDVGLPLGPTGHVVLVPANVAAFGEGLGLPADQVRLYLALREAAHQRLYAHVPWLRSRVTGALEDYARGFRVDTSAIEQAMAGVDPSDPESLQQALGSDLLKPQDTPEQQAALRRLEALLALVEGWVDEVVDAAAAPRLPSASALRETVRRRRATGGPAEATFAALVGLELRPRRLREAAALWRALAQARGTEGRDAIWSHPDLLPTVEDLEDPTGFVQRSEGGLDSGLDLSALEGLGEAPSEGDGPSEGEPGDGRPQG